MGSHRVGHDCSDLAAAAASGCTWKRESWKSHNTEILSGGTPRGLKDYTPESSFSQFSSSTSYGFSSSHVWIWELDYKESWVLKNWCFCGVVLEKTLECPLDSKEIQPVHPKGSQSWIFIRMTEVEAETPILWPPDAKIWLIWKYSDSGKDWR